MKNIFTIFAIAVIAISVNAQTAWTGTFSTSYAGGDGTKGSPYLINTADQLAFLAQNVNSDFNYSKGKYFQLSNDLNLGGDSMIEWIPIGRLKLNQFEGVFDGNGKTITNMYINVNNTDREIYGGLFGYMGAYSEVLNLGIKGNSVISVSSGSTVYLGAIAGYNYAGKITNCYNMANVSASSYSSISSVFAGGIVGINSGDGVIDGCYNVGNISSISNTSSAYAGGIVGSTFSGKVLNSYNTGNCTSSGYTSYAGGIAGFNSNYCNVMNCNNSGNISSTSSNWDSNAGGIVGLNAPNGTIALCYNDGNVVSVSNSNSSIGYYAFAGGIVGSNSNSDYSVTDCYNTGKVLANSSNSSSSACAGGVVGFNKATNYSIVNCYNVGSVASIAPALGTSDYSSYSSYSYAGAITGYSLYNTVLNCYSLDNTAMMNDVLSDEYINGTLLMTAPNMKTIKFVEALNNKQNPPKWAMDNKGINNGFPILK